MFLFSGTICFFYGKTLLRPKVSSADSGPRTPVLIELFTSEGCSSCPPADALLERLDRTQPVPGAEVIVLSEHVDYWNYIGWSDPFSSGQYSERQSAYSTHFRLNGVYTPQMVVDGRFELVGSDERGAVRAIEEARNAEKLTVRFSGVQLGAKNTISMHVETNALPASAGQTTASVLVAVADESDRSSVSDGENAGRTLTHVAVVRTLTSIGTVSSSGPFSRDVTLDLGKRSVHDLRLVGIVQEREAGRLFGLGSVKLSN
jgi:hypothetical protein